MTNLAATRRFSCPYHGWSSARRRALRALLRLPEYRISICEKWTNARDGRHMGTNFVFVILPVHLAPTPFRQRIPGSIRAAVGGLSKSTSWAFQRKNYTRLQLEGLRETTRRRLPRPTIDKGSAAFLIHAVHHMKRWPILLQSSPMVSSRRRRGHFRHEHRRPRLILRLYRTHDSTATPATGTRIVLPIEHGPCRSYFEFTLRTSAKPRRSTTRKRQRAQWRAGQDEACASVSGAGNPAPTERPPYVRRESGE